MYKLLNCIIFILLVPFQMCAQKSFVIVNNSKSDYKIVIPANANEIEKQSATILQDYIHKISNCKLPIVTQSASTQAHHIIIGRNKFVNTNGVSGLGGDGVLIKKINNALILTGGNRKGTLYSVYTLLEDYLGCRMYTVSVVEVPRTSSVTLPASIYKKQAPSFAYRTTLFLDALNNTFCDFHKMNYFFEDVGLWVHSFEALLPKDKYFQSHPEYYALVNGKRNADQLDLTNPTTLTLVIQNLQQLIKEKPDAKFWSVSPNDNANFCQCPNCTRLNNEQGSIQGSLLPFVNSVAKNFPDKQILHLAYLQYEKPPKTIKPVSNVLVMLATSDEERRVPLINQPASLFKNHFQDWSKITSQLFLWDYIVQFTNALSPFPNLYTLQPNIKYFASKNVKYIFEQGIGDFPGEFSELRGYLISRLMWNINANVKATIQEFTNGYYGKSGSVYINQYISLIHKNASLKSALLKSGGSPVNAVNNYLSPENIQAYKDIFKSALNATAGTVYNERIMKEYVPVLYAELEVNKSNLAGNKRIGSADKNKYIETLNDFNKRTKQLKIIYLNEARLKVDDYYKNYTDILNNKQ